MTAVEVIKQGEHIVSLTADGHTGYGVSGEDIVCAALSSIIQTAVLGLMQVAGINISLKRDDERGFIEFSLPKTNASQRHDADIILNTMLIGISDLYESYSDFIELSVTTRQKSGGN